MGKHSAEEPRKSGLSQLMGGIGRKAAGKHAADRHETASDVLEKANRKPMFAAIAIPTVAIAAVTAAGVGSQQGGGQVQASTNAIADGVSPLKDAKTAKHDINGKKYSVKNTSAEFTDPSDMGKGVKSSKASGQGGSCEASTYGEGDGTAGGPTASGETFDPSKLTAANKELPLGSVVKVTNKGNGKSVTVRINDRGPYVSGRCLDLSTAAMNKIAPGEGTIQVSYKVI